ncbi:hypothetical protein A2U01_0116116, partial [Trifolium medium]|nr:hypothetical protein [Trifolium medium]
GWILEDVGRSSSYATGPIFLMICGRSRNNVLLASERYDVGWTSVDTVEVSRRPIDQPKTICPYGED